MSSQNDHLISLQLADTQPCEFGGILEATGLFVNGFVKGDLLQDYTFEYSIEIVSPHRFVIRAKPRHPIEDSMFAKDRAFTPLYLICIGWFLAGADVKVEGPWVDSFPGQGTLEHQTAVPLQLRSLFQDAMPISERSIYPSLDSLAEIHRMLRKGSPWNEVKVSREFQDNLSIVSVHPKDANNVQLSHRCGLQLDLILKHNHIDSHVLRCVQKEIEAKFITCYRQVSVFRTWWDAWIGHCPTNDIHPKYLAVLPDEIAIFSPSGSICRYRLQNPSTLDRLSEVDFGVGVAPSRAIESWLERANEFGEAGLVDIAIGCCEQAIASASALIANVPGLTIPLPIGSSPRQLLKEAETEYCRWMDYKESLTQPKIPHSRWSDNVVCRGFPALLKRVGAKWEPTLQWLIEIIEQEHFDSHDHHRKIFPVREFSRNVEGEIGNLRYQRLFGRELAEAKVPKQALSKLGYEFQEETIPPHVEFVDIFTLTLGNERFWGSVENRVLLSRSDPIELFKLSR